ncbi:protein LAZY 1 isoform X1 [Daucus carota subsp. sativus]|uniref:protein LAZY 1 isoform X1 n=2 Tax=Daucus carota subsp. sativus TaxID=79200 RepID=UPI0007F02A7E|nr:PREDICTED: uncharacterized protein LOC108213329 isoform X2 [Daucus carota subsp. sativus]
MKVLNWMYRKSKQDNIQPLKKLSIGNSCSCLSAQLPFDEPQYHSEPSYTSAHTKQNKWECSRYSNGLKAKEEEVSEEESAVMMSELFHGFLTIGTLGAEPNVAEPTTPKFAISCQSANEKETLVTETELKLINNELEKFFEAEAKDVDYDSSERSSFVSTITLGGYHIEETDAQEDKNMVTWPLQQYLFSSSIECPEIGAEVKKEKRSLGDLFKNDYKNPEQQKEQNEEGRTATKGTCALKFMKKMLGKIHGTSGGSKCSVNDHAAGNVSTKRKLPKVLRLLQKRIHPEISIFPVQKMNKPHKYEDRTKKEDRAVTILEKRNHKFPKKTILKENVISVSNNHDSFDRSHSAGDGGHWIKTDADYLVLEL